MFSKGKSLTSVRNNLRLRRFYSDVGRRTWAGFPASRRWPRKRKWSVTWIPLSPDRHERKNSYVTSNHARSSYVVSIFLGLTICFARYTIRTSTKISSHNSAQIWIVASSRGISESADVPLAFKISVGTDHRYLRKQNLLALDKLRRNCACTFTGKGWRQNYFHNLIGIT